MSNGWGCIHSCQLIYRTGKSLGLATEPCEVTKRNRRETYRKAVSRAVTAVPVIGAVLKSSEESAKAQRPWVTGATTYS